MSTHPEDREQEGYDRWHPLIEARFGISAVEWQRLPLYEAERLWKKIIAEADRAS